MAQCERIKENGERCRGRAMAGGTLCRAHREDLPHGPLPFRSGEKKPLTPAPSPAEGRRVSRGPQPDKGHGSVEGAGSEEAGGQGLYGRIANPRIKALLDAAGKQDDPLDLLPHALMLQALVIDFVERYEALSEALLGWYGSVSAKYLTAVAAAQKNGEPPPDPKEFTRPDRVPDISTASALVSRVSAMVEKIEKRRERGSIDTATLNAALDSYAVHIAEAIRENIDDPDLRTQLGRAVDGKCRGLLDGILDRGRRSENGRRRRPVRGTAA